MGERLAALASVAGNPDFRMKLAKNPHPADFSPQCSRI
jgi:hypothetical protein